MIKKDRATYLGSESINKLLFEFSVPAIFGMIIQALYNIADRIFLGQVNQQYIGGVYTAYPIMMLILAFGMLIGIGGNSLSSIRMGQNRKDLAERILGNAITSSIILSIMLSLFIYFFQEPILRLFGASETLMPITIEYLNLILLGVPFSNLSFALMHFSRGDGSPKASMTSMLIGAITNIILDYIFILKMDMGVTGAGLGTIIGQAFSMIYLLWYFNSSRSFLKIKKENLRVRWKTLKEIISLGIAPFSMQLVAAGIMTLVNTILNKYGGDIAINAMGVINSISSLAFMPVFGMNQGSQPILGFNFGAQNYKRMKEALKKAIMVGTIYVIGFTILLFIFPDQLISFFISDPKEYQEILPIARRGLLLWHICLPILAFQIISSNYFQATGKPMIGTFLSLSRQLVILAPLLILFPMYFGIDGVWFAVVTSDLLSTLLTGIFLKRDLRRYPDIDSHLEREDHSLYRDGQKEEL